MINSKDEIVQYIKFGALELPIYNRNIIEEDSESLGYEKKTKEDNLVSNDEYGRMDSKLASENYELRWKLLLDDDEILKLFEIVSSHEISIRTKKKSGYYLYDAVSAVPPVESILLEDNRLKDQYTGNYEKYKINIGSLDKFIVFKISSIKNYYIVEFSAETLARV